MLDWGTVVVDSVTWTAKAFAITALVFVAVILAIVRFTRWGRQWWRIAASFFDPRNGAGGVALAAVVLLLTVFAVRISVLFSYWYNDFYTAIQNLDESAFWRFLRIFAILATIHVVRALIDYLRGQTLDIRWRAHLNERLVDDWLVSGSFYKDRFVSSPVDNPDQRIRVDITDFVTTTRMLSMGAVTAVLSIVSFTGILWDLSGPITIFGTEIPRAMVFLVILYVLVTTAVAFWISRPLIMLNFLNEKLGATYRYALVRVREYGESIAFYRGEGTERGGLLARFSAVIRNWWRIVFRTLKFNGFDLAVNQTAVIFPFLVQGPRLFAGQVTLGDVMQTSNAFGQVHDSLSFFRESYDEFAAFRATTIRLNGLLDTTHEAAELPAIAVRAHEDRLELTDLSVETPAGDPLVTGLSLGSLRARRFWCADRRTVGRPPCFARSRDCGRMRAARSTGRPMTDCSCPNILTSRWAPCAMPSSTPARQITTTPRYAPHSTRLRSDISPSDSTSRPIGRVPSPRASSSGSASRESCCRLRR